MDLQGSKLTNLSPSDIHCDIESENNDGNRESELAEATRTSYIEGRWVSEEEDVRMVYSINGAYLPGNGDYSSYHEWGMCDTAVKCRACARGSVVVASRQFPAQDFKGKPNEKIAVPQTKRKKIKTFIQICKWKEKWKKEHLRLNEHKAYSSMAFPLIYYSVLSLTKIVVRF